jgi:hypothetical protein
MAKKLKVDEAVEWLHREKLACRLVWDDKSKVCILDVYDGDTREDRFLVHDGRIEESEADIADMIQHVQDNRAVARHKTKVLA